MKYVIDSNTLTGIADAIRNKLDTPADIQCSQFASQIEGIPTGITPTGSITLTEERSYDVTDKATAVVDMSAKRASIAEVITSKGVDTLPDSDWDTLETNIGLISGGGGTRPPANISAIIDNPKYFQTEVGTLVRNIGNRSDDELVIFYITDSHIYASNNNKQYFDQQMAAMLAVAKAVKPDLVVHGGDMTNGSEAKSVTLSESLDVVKQMREVGGDNTLILIGNHDGNYVSASQPSSEMITEAEMLQHYRYWNDGFTYPKQKLYGYRDFPSKGIRVIRLHSYMGDGTLGGTGSNWGYPSDEVAWFKDVALNTNYDILLLSHQTLSPVLQGYDESQDIPHNGMQIQVLIDNWQNDARKCIGVLHGHVHWDYVRKGKGTFTVIDHNTKSEIQRVGNHGEFYEYGMGLANFQTNTTTGVPTSSYRDVPNGAIAYGRKANDVTQALWSAIVVDKANTRFSVYRFGAGSVAHYNYAEDVLMITSEPSDVNVEEGTDIHFSVFVNKPLSDTTFKWQFYVGGAWVDASVTGLQDTMFELTIPGEAVTTAYSGYKARCIVTYGNEILTTREATITITAKAQKVNVLTQAIDSSGNPYNNGQGWKSGYRLSSSGGESAASGMFVTGFIPVTKGKTVTFENIHLDSVNVANCYINAYNASKTLVKANYAKDWYAKPANAGTKDSAGWITSLTLNVDGIGGDTLGAMAYIRFSAPYIGSDSAVYIE